MTARTAARPPTPWSGLDGIRWAVTTAVAVAGGAWAWARASGASTLEDQLDWAVGVIGAALVAAYANVRWLLAGRRAIGRRRADVLGDPLDPVASDVDPAAPSTAGAAAARYVAGEGLHRFHHPDCPLAAGRSWVARTRSQHEAEGRTPCGVCAP